MNEYGLVPNNFTFLFVLKACSALSSIERGRKIHEDVIRSKWEKDVLVGSALIDIEGRSDVELYDCCICKKWASKQVARVVSRNMMGLRPSEVTLVTAISASSGIAALLQGRELHGFSWRHRFALNDKVKTSLVDMYAKCGRVKVARDLLEQLKEKRVVSWNVMDDYWKRLCCHGCHSQYVAPCMFICLEVVLTAHILMPVTSSSVLVSLPAVTSLIILLRYFSLDFEMQRKAATYNSKPSTANTISQNKSAKSHKVIKRSDWRRKVNSPVVEDAIDRLTRHILFLSGLQISGRMRKINLIDLLTSQATIDKQQSVPLTVENRDMEIRCVLAAEDKLHPALFSAEAEHKCLMDGLISFAFRHEDLQFSFFRFINERIESVTISMKKAKGATAWQQTSQSKPNGSSRISSDHFSRFLDPSATGVELVQKTQALAPENFENMWTKGRNYKRKEGGNLVFEQGLQHSVGKSATAVCSKATSKPREKHMTSFQEDDEHNLTCVEEVETGSSSSYTSEEEETGHVLDSPGTKLDPWVLCSIYHKAGKSIKGSSHSDDENESLRSDLNDSNNECTSTDQYMHDNRLPDQQV
ncbi:hypothetical protein Q3G72_027603 [Acer saccharum]|nr:hypothetical protein Q3G72_027603 [Acer saccharum]